MPQRSLVVNFIGDTAALEKSFARVGAGLNGIEAAGKRASSIGASMSRNLTVPIVGLGVASAKMASDFGSAMERLHTQAGVSQKAVAELSKGVLNMAGPVGIGPKTLADGIYHVASSLNATLSPVKRSSTELAVLRIAAEGARVGNANLVDVTNALDAAIVSGIKGVQNYGQAMGALNAIVGAGDMSMQDLADALSTGLLAPMRTYGLTLKDVGGALAVFGDNNIRGQDAATKLISAVRIMAAPSKAAAKELGGIHLSTLQLANDMRQGGIVKALTDLQTHLTDAGLTASQQGLVIARAFGGRQSTGVQVLLSQLDRLRVKTNDVGKGAAGFAQAWSATQLTASQKTKEALGTMEADLTRFGTVALPTLLSAGSTIVRDVDKVAHAFSSLPKGAQDAIITGGLITAGVGPALKLVGVVTGLVGKAWGLAKLVGGVAGLGKGAGLLSGKSLNQSVARMEVATMVVGKMVGGGGGGLPGGASTAEKDAIKLGEGGAAGAGGATIASRVSGLVSRIPEGAFAAVGAGAGVGVLFGSASAIRSLIGSPPTQEQLLVAMGLARPAPGHAPIPGQPGAPPGLPQAVAQGQRVVAEAALPQVYKDSEMALSALGRLDKLTHDYFGHLALAARQANDTKWQFADQLASDVLRGEKIGSKGITGLIASLNRLQPAARSAAASSMIQMAQQLEIRGKLPAGATARLRGEIGSEFEAMVHKAESSAARMASAIQGGSMKAFLAARTNFHDLFLSINAAMSASVISVQTGVSLIDQAINSELSTFGAGPINFGSKTLSGALQNFPKLSSTFPGASAPHTAARHPSPATLQALGIQDAPSVAKNSTTAPSRLPSIPKAPSLPRTPSDPAWLTALARIPSQATLNQIQAQALQNAAAAAGNAGNDAAQQAAITRELALEKSFLIADKRQLERVNAILAHHRLTRGQRSKVQGYKLALENELGSLLGTISGLDSSLAGAASAGGFDLAPSGASVTLPTAYDVRTTMARGSHVHLHVHAPIHVTHARDGVEIKRIVEESVAEMGDKIDRATGGHLHARLRAAGIRGS